MRESLAEPLSPRAALLAVLALAMAPAVGQGIGRFAYALVLPDMRADFGWSYGEAGVPNTANALGYLLGAMIGGRVAASLGAFRTVAAGTILAALATGLCAFTTGQISFSTLRFVAGLAAALGLVAGGAVAMSIAATAGARAALIVAMFYVGPPFGIILSALVTPVALAGGEGSWRIAWAALGLLGLAMAGAFALKPLRRARAIGPEPTGGAAPLRAMAWLLAGYGLFGAGYIAYMTFMIAFLRDSGASVVAQSAFWCVIGVAGIVSPWLWSGPLTRLRNGWAFAAPAFVTFVGAALPLAANSYLAEIASAAVFGSAFFTVVAATTVFIRRNLPREVWTSSVGAMTVAFSLGQAAGPVLTGVATDIFGGLGVGLTLGAILLGLAAFVALLQRELPPPA